MNFFTLKSFPTLLNCRRCKLPPKNPRLSMCECYIYCQKCIKFKAQTYKCSGCEFVVKSSFQNIPDFYMYLLENIMIKCQICLNYLRAQMFQKHFNECKRKRQKEISRQQFDKYLCDNKIDVVSRLDSHTSLTEDEITEFDSHSLMCKLCNGQISGIEIIQHFSVCGYKIISCDDVVDLFKIVEIKLTATKFKNQAQPFKIQFLSDYFENQII